jgi:predicted porin
VHKPFYLFPILLLAAAGAQAQSSVTIYGSIDAGVSSFNDELGARSTKLDTGNRSPNRFGFRGSEDLGDGMHALFGLEGGFNADDGTLKRANTLFNRAAWVGLSSDAGTLSLGHMPDFMYDYLRFTGNGFQTSLYFFHPGNLDNQANQFQIDNAVKYESPTFHGFTFGAMNGFGEHADDFNQGRSYSLGLRYAGDNLRGAAAYTVSNNRSLNLGATLGLDSLLGQTLSSNAVAPNATYTNFNADKMTSAGITAAYRIGRFTPNAMVTQIRLDAPGGSATMRNVELGTRIATARSNTVGVSLAASRLESVRWNQFNLIDMVSLSPHTTVYAAAAFQRASGDDAHAVIQGALPASGQSQRVLRLGIDHAF